jgi:C1A family cysteine protease
MPWRLAYIKRLRRYREKCKLPTNIKTRIVDYLIVVRIVGYNDKMKIKNANLKGSETTGVIMISNTIGME